MSCRGFCYTPSYSSCSQSSQITYTGCCGDISCNPNVRDDALRECGSQCCVTDLQNTSYSQAKNINPTAEPKIETSIVGKYDDSRTSYSFKVPQGYTLYCETANMAYQSDKNGCVNLALQNDCKYQFKLINDSTNYFLTEKGSYKTKVFEVDVNKYEAENKTKNNQELNKITALPENELSTSFTDKNKNKDVSKPKQDVSNNIDKETYDPSRIKTVDEKEVKTGEVRKSPVTQNENEEVSEVEKGNKVKDIDKKVDNTKGGQGHEAELKKGIKIYCIHPDNESQAFTFSCVIKLPEGCTVCCNNTCYEPDKSGYVNITLPKDGNNKFSFHDERGNDIKFNNKSNVIISSEKILGKGKEPPKDYNANIGLKSGLVRDLLNPSVTKVLDTSIDLNTKVQCKIKVPDGYSTITFNREVKLVENGFVTFDLPKSGDLRFELYKKDGNVKEITLKNHNLVKDQLGLGNLDLENLPNDDKNVIINSRKNEVPKEDNKAELSSNSKIKVVRVPRPYIEPGIYDDFVAYKTNERSKYGDNGVVCKIKVPEGYSICYDKKLHPDKMGVDGYYKFDWEKGKTYYFTLIDREGHALKYKDSDENKTLIVDVNKLEDF